MLLWSGARCWTRTNAMPGSPQAGIADKKASNAASPPADAPMPTIGKPGVAGRAAPALGADSTGRETRSFPDGTIDGLVAEDFFFISGQPQPACPRRGGLTTSAR